MIKQILLQCILILLNAFFAATEIAVISLNEKKIQARAENGDKKAFKMLKMLEEPTRFLSTIQIGITLAGFLGSAFAADNFAERLSGFLITTFNIPAGQIELINTVAVIVITLILSFFTLVLGELVPKRVAMNHKEKFAEIVCGSITVLATVLKPIIWLLTVSTNGVLRLMGIDPNKKEESVSEEDIVIMLDAGVDEGTLDEEDITYIKNVFKLDKLTAADVMTLRKAMVFISSDATEKEILEVIENEGYSRIPVYSDSTEEITGILQVKQYLISHAKSDFVMASVMTPPIYVPETLHLDLLLKEMQKDHNHMVVVVNEYGIPSGIVTLEDIMEELVGEIWDEGDEEIIPIVKNENGSYTIQATTSLDEFFEFFHLEKDDDIGSTTINGWLTEKLETIPKAGDEFMYSNLNISVSKAGGTMAQEITVTLHSAKTEK